MLSDEVIDKVVERLVNRLENANEYIIRKIGDNIKKIGTLSPSKAHQLIQILRYGGDYDKIVKKLSEVTNLNLKDIDEIFKEVAKTDYNFARQFYRYRGKKFIPFDENIELQNQVKALAKITKETYMNMTKTMAYAIRENGKIKYTKVSRAYQKILDEAVLNVMQGKESFDSMMYKSIKDLSSKGIRVVEYTKDGKVRHLRVDSAVRMQMKNAITDLHNELQKTIAKDIDADGYEVSVHNYPAPDHEKVQGRQFNKVEFKKFQNNLDAQDIKGMKFPAISEETKQDRRSIGQYNCYHYIFAIIIGVNQPQYSEEELQQIIDDNEKGFTYNGKHYTMYEGTQIQRKLETEIRKLKDEQIIAKSSGNKDYAMQVQRMIDATSQEYKRLCDISKLPTKKNRMRVSGYRRIKVVE